MNSFYYNQKVSAENLNTIARDLGSANFKLFSDTQIAPFAVQKLNLITGDLVGKGVLNSGNKCTASKSANILKLSTGTIVFGNGAKISVQTEMSFSIIPASVSYLYAELNLEMLSAAIMYSAVSPAITAENIVLLAEVTPEGYVYPRADRFSVAKNFSNLSNNAVVISIPDISANKDTVFYQSGSNNLSGESLIKYKYVMLYFRYSHYYMGIFDISNNLNVVYKPRNNEYICETTPLAYQQFKTDVNDNYFKLYIENGAVKLINNGYGQQFYDGISLIFS